MFEYTWNWGNIAILEQNILDVRGKSMLQIKSITR